ncbi:hypothetical protein PUN28_017036 [Cardiocondyla obscurior]|uniref:Uncharacterized protein n=1 Tax=Cardiocondyla obscurior TaxID=286306 RepID=A0AAW2EK06_9HYME
MTLERDAHVYASGKGSAKDSIHYYYTNCVYTFHVLKSTRLSHDRLLRLALPRNKCEICKNYESINIYIYICICIYKILLIGCTIYVRASMKILPYRDYETDKAIRYSF